MEIYELKEHCREQLKKLPRTSKMYEEHLLVLALIEANKKYFEELEQKEKQIEVMAEYIADISDCPLENCNTDLDCGKCNADIEKECWIKYFEGKVKGE